jgi:hypothetical protein
MDSTPINSTVECMKRLAHVCSGFRRLSLDVVIPLADHTHFSSKEVWNNLLLVYLFFLFFLIIISLFFVSGVALDLNTVCFFLF